RSAVGRARRATRYGSHRASVLPDGSAPHSRLPLTDRELLKCVMMVIAGVFSSNLDEGLSGVGGSNEKAPGAAVQAIPGATSRVGSTGFEPVTSTMST